MRRQLPRSLSFLLALASAATAPGAVESGAPLFVEVTAEAGLDFVHFNGMSGRLYFAEMTGAGAALVDYDGDGDLDAYLVQGHLLGDDVELADATFQPAHPLPLTDRLYRRDADPSSPLGFRYVDVTGASGLAAHGYGMGVAAGDVDGDGLPDLYVTNLGPNQLWINRGDGTFRDATAASGVGDDRWSVPAAFFDADHDGRLDLYVGNYVDFRIATHKPCATATGAFDYCGPLAYQPEPDRLFRNRGDGTFEDVSAGSGIRQAYGGALGLVTADFDSDGWTDVYVANDGVPNQLWMNREGGARFVDEALLGGCAVNEAGQPEASMGVVVGDLDGSGTPDLFMAHLTRETNTLYLNDGRGFFQDASRASGLGAPSWSFTGFGTALFDYDLDGRLDLFVANGAVKRIEELVRAGDPYPLHQTNQLFRNLGAGRFTETTAAAGEALAPSEVSRGVAVGDVDEDGAPDLLVANNAGPARLLLDRAAAGRPWLAVEVRDAASGRALLGSEVRAVRDGGPPLVRRVATDGSYASASAPRAIFGLAGGGAPEAVEVTPPGGTTRRLFAPPPGRTLVFRLPAVEAVP